MSRLPVPLSSFEVFAEAGRLQSFRKAAESLSLTTSAVSQSIRKLEDRLGCQLFDRTGNAVRLSNEGLRLLREVETAIEHIRDGLDAIQTRPKAPLSISTPPGFGGLLTPVVQQLLALNSSDVRLVSDEAQDDTSFRNFDVAIVYGRAASSHDDVESLGVDVFMPVCRPDIAAKLTGASALTAVPLLVNETASVTWDDWFKVNGVSARSGKRLHFNRAAQVISAVLDGVGVALESLRLMSPHIKRGDLVCCPVANAKAIRREFTHLYVSRNPEREQAEKVASLIRMHCATGDDGFLSDLGAGAKE